MRVTPSSSMAILSIAALLSSRSAIAQADSPAPHTVTDFAAAEAALEAAPRFPKGRPTGSALRTSPDGRQRAWIVGHSGMLSLETPSKPDSIEVVVEEVATAAKQTARMEVAHFEHDRRCGPVWTADGGVLVAYDVKGKATATDACVDVVRNGEAKAFLRQAEWSVRSVAASPAGPVAITLAHSWNGSTAVVVCSADGNVRATIDTSKPGCVAAAPSPDGSEVALLLEQQIAVVPATGGEPRKLAALDHADNDITSDRDVPTWLADGKSFVVAAGGEVVHVDASNGELRRWTAAALGGTAVDVVVLPGDTIAGVIALHQTDANLADVIMHAGCASKSTFLDLVWLDLQSGKSQPSSIANKWVTVTWVDMPKVGYLAARFGR